MRTLCLLFLLCLPPFAAAQEDPLHPASLTYVATLGEGEIGRETVTLAPDGWSSAGSFDVFGMQKGAYTARVLRHADGKQELEVTSDSGDKKFDFRGVFEAGKLRVQVSGMEDERSVEIEGGPDAFFFENLLWASMVDLGRILAAKEAAGTLEPGAKITALLASGATEFPVEHLGTQESTQTVRGHAVALRVSKVRLPPQVDVTLICTPEGLPLRMEIPGQQITVVAEGYETIASTRRPPTSLVDSGPWRELLSPPDYKAVIQRQVMVPMRDGVALAADIYVPEGKGPFPTVLARTPYKRITEAALKGEYFARRGYAFVAQDVRGRFDSEGEWLPFMHEARDGSDTLDWIAQQPWSDGKIGMVGASYVGMVQWLAAKSGNPHLRCIVPQVSPPDPQENFPYEGGAFHLGAGWWARVLESMDHGTSWAEGVDWEQAFATLPLADFDQALQLSEQEFLDVWLAHPPHDREYWEPASYQDSFGSMDLPVLHISGWFDGDMPGAILNYPGMRAGAKTEAARRAQYLILGPWTHMFNSARSIGDVDFGDEAVVDLDARILRFFDRYLKGIDNGIEDEPPVLVFTMGSNRWSAEADWPLPQTAFTPLHLSSAGHATTRDGDGRLGLAPPREGAASDTFHYDPMDVPAFEVDITDLSGAEATADQSDEPDRADALDYTSPPLAGPCELVGPVKVVVFAATDAADTDFVAALYRLTPAGQRFALAGGVQRLRYATDPRKDAPVPPGTVTRVEIDCWAKGLRLQAGERIQLEISSWAWPAYGRNLNTLEPQDTATTAVVAANTIYHDAQHASHVLLPVVPREDAPGLSFAEE